MTAAGFPHSDTPGSQLGWQLPGAYRGLPRPSSVPGAKASTVCPYKLGHRCSRPLCSSQAATSHPDGAAPPPGARAAVWGPPGAGTQGETATGRSLRTQQRATARTGTPRRPGPHAPPRKKKGTARGTGSARRPSAPQRGQRSTHEQPPPGQAPGPAAAGRIRGRLRSLERR
jgi:hypothetical protein